MSKLRGKRWSLLSAVALLLASLSGCGLEGPQSTVAPAGPVADLQYDVFLVTLWVSVGIFAVMGTLLVYCIAKFKVKEGEVTDQVPEQGHGGALTEIALILVSVGLVGVIALPTLTGIFWVGTVPADENILEINVTGYQWWWSFEYPKEGVVTGNEIAIPIGRPVKFNLRTNDVLHSFWVPRLGGKVDLMTGQENWLWLQADGELKGAKPLPPGGPVEGHYYYGQCAEFCGQSHAFMRFRVLVLDDENYRKWLEHQKSDAVEASTDELMAGQKAFMENNCASCHMIRGVRGASGLVGPDLTHVGSRISLAAGIMDNTEENMKAWIREPHRWKPGNIMYTTGYQAMNIQLDEGEIDSLAKYLGCLK